LRWGKASAFWLCGFAAGAAVVYGALWGKEQYDSYRTLQALNLPAPVTDNAAAKLFTPTPPGPPTAPVELSAAPAEALAKVEPRAEPQFKAGPAVPVVAVVKPARAPAARTQRPRRTALAKAPARKATVVARQSVRLSDRRAAPRVLEIRRSAVAAEIRPPCRRGDLARECYVAR
jgi:hypothetical protein